MKRWLRVANAFPCICLLSFSIFNALKDASGFSLRLNIFEQFEPMNSILMVAS